MVMIHLHQFKYNSGEVSFVFPKSEKKQRYPSFPRVQKDENARTSARIVPTKQIVNETAYIGSLNQQRNNDATYF